MACRATPELGGSPALGPNEGSRATDGSRAWAGPSAGGVEPGNACKRSHRGAVKLALVGGLRSGEKEAELCPTTGTSSPSAGRGRHWSEGGQRDADRPHTLCVYPGALATDTVAWPVAATQDTTADAIIEVLTRKLSLDPTKRYVLAEVRESGGEEWILDASERPVRRMMLWPRSALRDRRPCCSPRSSRRRRRHRRRHRRRRIFRSRRCRPLPPLSPRALSSSDYRFLLREQNVDGSIQYDSTHAWVQRARKERQMVARGFLPQRYQDGDLDDLCCLPELSEAAILSALRARYGRGRIYTYAGSILVAINPFRFLPIYNPRFVQLYDGRRLGELEPHIFAVADAAYHAMLRERVHQCLVISGESGSGKTQSTNFLIHHLTALSQRGYTSGVERTILGAGPVLEAFGNAKTAHNDNSSRFGKFIQVNYRENGTVRGAIMEKYLLEKSRLVSQEKNERNYHVFYYLLEGTTEEEREFLHLLPPSHYNYLNQTDINRVEGEDLKHDFERLKLAMEMVGFLPKTRVQIFTVLSAVLSLGNVSFRGKTCRDDTVEVELGSAISTVSELLQVKESSLIEALTTRKTVAVGEKLIVPFRLCEAITARDSMAKSLYVALFDWILLRINHALLHKRDLEENVQCLSIGVLDIFGFEDFTHSNSFEQFCINFANEQLHHYFNKHIFKIEQEEYASEGIVWHNIDYVDNLGCIQLVSRKPTGLFHLLDEECNFPQANSGTLLRKFRHQHERSEFFEIPAVMEAAFIIRHFAGRVKYQIKDFREKNTDHMRADAIALLRGSSSVLVRALVSLYPVALLRWAVLRALLRSVRAFQAGATRRAGVRSVVAAAAAAAALSGDGARDHRGIGVDGGPLSPVFCPRASGSFLMHPVHQRSLQILRRCSQERVAEISHAGAPLSSSLPWDGGCGMRRRGSWDVSRDDIFACAASTRLRERTNSMFCRKNNSKPKINLPKHLVDIRSLQHVVRLSQHERPAHALLQPHPKKRPPSISAQFQASLNKLLDTLNQALPYFIRCLRSNDRKDPMRFDEELVLRQLRYTGMLETVRIRRAGYSTKYTFQEFKERFGVLMPRDAEPRQADVGSLLQSLGLDPNNYQIGRTKVFLKESARQFVQDCLHDEVSRRVVLLQRRLRCRRDRAAFQRQRSASLLLQRAVRAWLSEQRFLRCVESGRDFWQQRRDSKYGNPAVPAAIIFQACLAKMRLRGPSRLPLCAEGDEGVTSGYLGTVLVQRVWPEGAEKAATHIQATWRGWRLRVAYGQLRHATLILQVWWRARQSRARFVRLRAAVVGLQARWRGQTARARFRELQRQEARPSAAPPCPARPASPVDSRPPTDTDPAAAVLSAGGRHPGDRRSGSAAAGFDAGSGGSTESDGIGGGREAAEAASRDDGGDRRPPVAEEESGTSLVVARHVTDDNETVLAEESRGVDAAAAVVGDEDVAGGGNGCERHRGVENELDDMKEEEVEDHAKGVVLNEGQETVYRRHADDDEDHDDDGVLLGDTSVDTVSMDETCPNPVEAGEADDSPVSLCKTMDNFVSILESMSDAVTARETAAGLVSLPETTDKPVSPYKEPNDIATRTETVNNVVSAHKDDFVFTNETADISLCPSETPDQPAFVPETLDGSVYPKETQDQPVCLHKTPDRAASPNRTPDGSCSHPEMTMEVLVSPGEDPHGCVFHHEAPGSPACRRKATDGPLSHQEAMEVIASPNDAADDTLARLETADDALFRPNLTPVDSFTRRETTDLSLSPRDTTGVPVSCCVVAARRVSPPATPDGKAPAAETPRVPSSLPDDYLHRLLDTLGEGDCGELLREIAQNLYKRDGEEEEDDDEDEDDDRDDDGGGDDMDADAEEGGGAADGCDGGRRAERRSGAAKGRPEFVERRTRWAGRPKFAPPAKPGAGAGVSAAGTSLAYGSQKTTTTPPPSPPPSSPPAAAAAKEAAESRVPWSRRSVQTKLTAEEVDTLVRMIVIKQENLESEGRAHHIPGLQLQHFNLPLGEKRLRAFGPGASTGSGGMHGSAGRVHLRRLRNFLSNKRVADKKTSHDRPAGAPSTTTTTTTWRWSQVGSVAIREKESKGHEEPSDVEIPAFCGLPPSSSRSVGKAERSERRERAATEPPSSPSQPDTPLSRKRSIRLAREAPGGAQGQWNNSTGKVAVRSGELQRLDGFLLHKISDLLVDPSQDSEADVLFKNALKDFRGNVQSLYSASLRTEVTALTYKDLVDNFTRVLEKGVPSGAVRRTTKRAARGMKGNVGGTGGTGGTGRPCLPVTMGVNTMQVLIDEFVREAAREEEALNSKVARLDKKKRKKKEMENAEERLGHAFRSVQFNIPTSCEQCGAFMWMMDRGYVCKLCKYTCHRRCCERVLMPCPGSFLSGRRYEPHVLDGSARPLTLASYGGRHFGVPLTLLASPSRAVPEVLERLVRHVETQGLYCEGVYRKSGSANRARRLRSELEADVNGASLEGYQVHVVTGVLKQWLRELPEPLFTYEYYHDFLRAVELPDKREQVRCVYSVIDKLPQPHHSALQRLIFHLVRVAQQEETNRMSASALAIVFAPCVLRGRDGRDPLLGMREVAHATACLELIIGEQMTRVQSILADIASLDTAHEAASHRLLLVLQSLESVKGKPAAEDEGTGGRVEGLTPTEDISTLFDQDVTAIRDEERILREQLQSIQEEREELSYGMLALEPCGSDEETLDSGASLGTADSAENILQGANLVSSSAYPWTSLYSGAPLPALASTAGGSLGSEASLYSCCSDDGATAGAATAGAAADLTPAFPARLQRHREACRASVPLCIPTRRDDPVARAVAAAAAESARRQSDPTFDHATRADIPFIDDSSEV
ncbi:LOW QUALITY PROTEIN: unconventional myosin-IXb-like [Lethenteron reissneri]|uniref:LOW QUALITY PROTEIN: unconventional myosin-IXb-like n=1 Tax=Lethenteron reissneri TaxID=7753 RepID=UPI002AB6AC2A|nr:LOW QUALITY PROTEIN: unconventional myosin-IXb-like [Lethenteron reissneri]